MSYKVSLLVYSRKIGSPVRKAVMAYFAERASDNGEGIWASKSTIASAIECGRSTVIRTINDFVSEGLISPVGKRKHRNGETIEYKMNLGAISKLEEVGDSPKESPRAGPVPERDQSQSGTGPVPERDPYQSQSGTQTVIGTVSKPSNNDQSAPDPSFLEFWERWPLRRTTRKKAEMAFKRLSKANQLAAIESVRPWATAWRASNPTANDIHPTTYLNGHRWLDEFGTSSQANPERSEKVQRWRQAAGG